MADFTAKDVQRSAPGRPAPGMLDAKRALEENDGDFDAARSVAARAGPGRRGQARRPRGVRGRGGRRARRRRRRHRRAALRDRLRRQVRRVRRARRRARRAASPPKGEEAVDERQDEIDELRTHPEGEHRDRPGRPLRGRPTARSSTPTCTSRPAAGVNAVLVVLGGRHRASSPTTSPSTSPSPGPSTCAARTCPPTRSTPSARRSRRSRATRASPRRRWRRSSRAG